jgi:hypothetical protein
VAGKSQRDRATYWLREAQFDQAPERVGLYETILAAEAMEMQGAQGAAAVLNRGYLVNFHYVRQA